MYEFRWIEWNIDHIGKHNVAPDDAEYVVNHARSPYPRTIDNDKTLVWGQTPGGGHLQVIYLLEEDDTVFVIHARWLTEKEKRQYRQKRKRT